MTSDPENLGQSLIRSSGLPELLPLSRMKEIAAKRRGAYLAAEPYPHIVIDGFFDEWVLNAVLAEFPTPKDKNWVRHDVPEEIKLQSKHERDIPPFARQLLYALNSASFLEFLEGLTGIFDWRPILRGRWTASDYAGRQARDPRRFQQPCRVWVEPAPESPRLSQQKLERRLWWPLRAVGPWHDPHGEEGGSNFRSRGHLHDNPLLLPWAS